MHPAPRLLHDFDSSPPTSAPAWLRVDADRYLVGNMVGDMAEMTAAELDRLCALDLVPGDGLYETAFEKLFVASADQRAQQQLLALRLERSRSAPGQVLR